MLSFLLFHTASILCSLFYFKNDFASHDCNFNLALPDFLVEVLYLTYIFPIYFTLLLLLQTVPCFTLLHMLVLLCRLPEFGTLRFTY